MLNDVKKYALFVLAFYAVFSGTAASAAPFGYAADGDTTAPSPFYRIDFATNTITQIGTVNPSMESLSFGPRGATLYGTSDTTDSLYTINTTSAALTLVGPLNVASSGAPGSPPSDINNPGLAFCPDNNTMYLADTASLGRVFSVNLSSGQVTYIGQGVAGSTPTAYNPSALACSQTGVLYAVSDTDDALFTINRTTGEATLVGPLGIDISNSGLGDLGSGLVLVTDRTPTILYSVNRLTGAATVITQLSASGLSLESMAVDVEAAGGPINESIPTLSEWAMIFMASLMAMFGIRRMRRTK